MKKLKAVFFDLDGVLIDARDWHKEAFNEALLSSGNTPLSEEEHLQEFDGLPTKKKLEKLLSRSRVSPEDVPAIIEMKDSLTMQYAKKRSTPNPKIQDLLRSLKADGYHLACCSNSIMSSVKLFLELAGIIPFFDLLLSNQDVVNPKPAPDIYLKAMQYFSIKPEEALIFEDSEVGLESAYKSGAHVFHVRSLKDVCIEKAYPKIEEINGKA